MTQVHVSLRTQKSIPSSVKLALSKMSLEQQSIFEEEYQRKIKSLGITYLCFLFSFHYLYLGKVTLFFLYWITFAGLGFWALFDLFRIPGLVREMNESKAIQTMRDHKIMAA